MSEETVRSERPWLRFYPSAVSPTYEYPEMNVARLLIDSAQAYPDKAALEFLGRTYSYKKLLRLCYRMANGLRALGIAKGDRVAIMLPNCPQAVIAYYGALMAGAVVVQTNPLYKERELTHQLSDSGAKAIVVLDLLSSRVLAAKPSSTLEHVIVTSLSDGLPFPKNILYLIKRRKEYPQLKVRYRRDGLIRWSSWIRKGSAQPICEEADAREDVAMIQYTGGTTGTPKGVMLTHLNLIANTVQGAEWCYAIGVGKEKYLAALPLFHVFGLSVLLNQGVYRAGTLVLLPRFESKMAIDTIRRVRPTIFPGAPTMYISLMSDPKTQIGDLASIKVCVSGAAPLPREVQEKFEKMSGGRLIEGYGLTEAAPVTHCNPLWGSRKSGTIGVPIPDTDSRILGPDSLEPLPVGEIGELAVKGPQVMKGYWNRPEETAAVLQEGWLRTGDLATMDEDGFFTIVDRKKDVIIAGGFNVYPREVEEALFEHPGILAAAVIGVADDYRGETVKAYVVLKSGWQVSEMQLTRWCRDRLASFKVPRLFEFRSELPVSIVGKVVRRMLKEERAEGD